MTDLERQEFGRRAREVYEERVRDLVEPQYVGKFLSLDVESGDYEIADVMLEASKKLRERHPGKIFYGFRIGYTTVYSMGGQMKRTKPRQVKA